MALSTPEIILKSLIKNSEYSARVLPFIKADYFERREEKVLFEHIAGHVTMYKALPSIEAIYISLSDDKSLNEKEIQSLDEVIGNIKASDEESGIDWLIDTTEKFCQERAVHNALTTAIQIVEGDKKGQGTGAIIDIMKQAVSVTFDASLGHDFIEDAEKRYEYYHKVENKVPFNLDYLNKTTKGGFSKKTLNLFMAGPHVGKTALMCHQASWNLRDGRNVVYFTMEMAEEEISKRIDANILDLSIDEVLEIPKDVYLSKINRLRTKNLGKLIVKEYPMGSAHAGHFRSFLNELRLKQNFVPDIIYVDYLNICASERMAGNKTVNSYGLMKSISEEIRGLASETNTVIVSATQFNRSGFDNSDPDMGDIAESFAVNFGVDYLAALVVNEDLIARNQVLVKQIKNRFDDKNKIPRFMIGLDRSKMKFFDVDDAVGGLQKEQTTDSPSIPQISKTKQSGGYSDFHF